MGKFNSSFASTENLNLLNEFRDSGQECAEIKGFTHKTPRVCYQSFQQTIKRFSMTSLVKCVMKNDRVFLVKLNS